MTIEFTKGDRKKIIRHNEERIKILEDAGWVQEGKEKEPTERELLFVKAEELELDFPKNISTEKLKALVEEASK